MSKAPRLKLLNQELELQQITPEARKQAACVLEVLAGVRTPEQAATALSVALPTYYNLEIRALRGLIWACTPQPPGRTMGLTSKLRAAEVKSASLEKQLQRYQALLRNTQRNIGLLPPPQLLRDSAKGKRKARKPAVRALRAIEAIRSAQASPPESAAPTAAARLPQEVVAATG